MFRCSEEVEWCSLLLSTVECRPDVVVSVSGPPFQMVDVQSNDGDVTTWPPSTDAVLSPPPLRFVDTIVGSFSLSRLKRDRDLERDLDLTDAHRTH
jgi:hypothetical protein